MSFWRKSPDYKILDAKLPLRIYDTNENLVVVDGTVSPVALNGCRFLTPEMFHKLADDTPTGTTFFSDDRSIGRWAGVDSEYCVCTLGPGLDPLTVAGTIGVNHDVCNDTIAQALLETEQEYRVVGASDCWLTLIFAQVQPGLPEHLGRLAPDSVGALGSPERAAFERNLREFKMASLVWY